jgi:hypothetical protein
MGPAEHRRWAVAGLRGCPRGGWPVHLQRHADHDEQNRLGSRSARAHTARKALAPSRGSGRGRRMGGGRRSAYRGSGAPQSGAAPGGGRLRPGCPRAVRPHPEVHARRWPVAARRPSACCSRPGGRRQLRRQPGGQPRDADRRRRRLAHGPAPCRPGCRSQASRRASSRGRREPPSRVQTDRIPQVRASDVARMEFPAGLTATRPTSPERQTPRRTPRTRPAARRARPPPS